VTFGENEQKNVLPSPRTRHFLDEWPFLSIRNLEHFHRFLKTGTNPTN